MDSEAIEFTCPCCQSTLGLDDTGDLYAITDARGGKAGINGIKTVTAGAAGNDWQSELYIATEPKQYVPPAIMIAGVAGNRTNNQPIEDDPALMAAHHKDLKERNIN